MSFGSSTPQIYLDHLGMPDPEARLVVLELPDMWITNVYAPATGDEERQ